MQTNIVATFAVDPFLGRVPPWSPEAAVFENWGRASPAAFRTTSRLEHLAKDMASQTPHRASSCLQKKQGRLSPSDHAACTGTQSEDREVLPSDLPPRLWLTSPHLSQVPSAISTDFTT